MEPITDEQLIEKAKSVVNSREIANGCTVGDVGAALITDKGNIYTGVCIDTASGMGFCAEANAIGAMITAGEMKIKKIVAVLGDGTILPPCGRCREFMRQIQSNSLETEVVIAPDKTVKLEELLPYPW